MVKFWKLACVIAALSATLALAEGQTTRSQIPSTARPSTPQPTVPRDITVNRFPPSQFWPPIRRRVTCENLKNLKLPHAQILSAQTIPAGAYTPPPPPPTVTLYNLPAFCRVVGMSAPTANSTIGFEVWLPLGGKYNGKYEQVGNGGFAGQVAYSALAEGIRRGYATASTDDGHQGFQDPTFAQISPDKITDFGWRALKETADKAKTIIGAFYGVAPAYSYFFGCSDGGREALMEAERYPNDFDGIIASAPANYWTHQFTGIAWNVQAAFDHTTLAGLVPPAKLAILSSAVRAQCAGHDGGLPGDKFLTDPRMCIIDWSTIACAPGQNPATCLSPAQVAAVKAIYAGPNPPWTSTHIFPGFEPGAEDDPADWQFWITGPSGLPPFPTFGLQTFFGEGFFANFVFHVPVYNLMLFNFTTDLAAADALAPTMNSTDPNLAPFRAHGGKLIQYAGWADSAVAPRNSINYYEAVRSALGSISYADQQNFYRLFLAPGMGHCSGGPGPNAFGNIPEAPAPVADADHDVLMALERWREIGVAPPKIVATKYVGDNPAGGVDYQRPLCPYPQMPRYDGMGLDPKSASSWSCHAPREIIKRVGFPVTPFH